MRACENLIKISNKKKPYYVIDSLVHNILLILYDSRHVGLQNYSYLIFNFSGYALKN